ncbi:hypothetical protein F2Q70_00031114 [Brassica cretica]|nr:hypothetical protein F2Q70_00031114 [Brassica cretica]
MSQQSVEIGTVRGASTRSDRFLATRERGDAGMPHASVAAIWLFKDDPVTLQYCDPLNIDSMHKPYPKSRVSPFFKKLKLCK